MKIKIGYKHRRPIEFELNTLTNEVKAEEGEVDLARLMLRKAYEEYI